MELLNRARKINAMLQKSAGNAVNFNDMSATLSEVIKGNVFILSRRGKLLGFAINDEIENERMKSMLEERRFPDEYTQGLFNVFETTANLDIDSIYSVFPIENRELFQSGLTTIVPIIDRKSTRLNSSHVAISYAVFCLKKKT